MKPKVCSFELSKKIKELRVKQDSLWYWQYNGKNSHLKEYTLELDKKTYGISKKDCSAFTVAELGEMLPDGYITKRLGKRWIGAGFDIDDWTIIVDTEANARAKMLISLLENKLIKGG